jgi:hypothetical protein
MIPRSRLNIRLGAVLAVLPFAVLPLYGCTTAAPPVPTSFAPLRYDYLTRLALSVGSVELDDSWKPPYIAGEVGALSPVPPVQALREMARDRLFASGGAGKAVFRIEDASIVQGSRQLRATFAVRLDITDGGGGRTGYAEARVVRMSPFGDDSNMTALRAALYSLTRATMDDMNVEFEYQIRRSLKPFLSGGDAPGGPAGVQSEPLGAPGSGPPGSSPPGSGRAPELEPAPRNRGPLQLAPPPALPLAYPSPAYPPQPYPPQPYPPQSYPGQPYPGQPYPGLSYPAAAGPPRTSLPDAQATPDGSGPLVLQPETPTESPDLVSPRQPDPGGAPTDLLQPPRVIAPP